MQSIFTHGVIDEMTARVARLSASTRPLWGSMNAAQMLAHVAHSYEVALDERVIRTAPWFIRLLGRLLRAHASNDKPLRRNSPTSPDFLIADERDFETEKARFLEKLRALGVRGPDGLTKKPHGFFGPLTPDERAKNLYKHTDHHLTQFGV